jgi:predicted dehydrogenase
MDVMCQITAAKPVLVHGVGARLTEDMPPGMYNYGHLHVTFEDGSVGWYEAGWGPMMSEQAYFVKDVIGPKGSVSIVMAETTEAGLKSSDMDAHTKTNQILLHHGALAPDGTLLKPDERIDTADEPGHDELCEREQRFLLRAIDGNLDLSDHMNDAVRSLRIVLAADEAVRTGAVVRL